MRPRVGLLLVAALLPLAGCVDALLESDTGPEDGVDNGTNVTTVPTVVRPTEPPATTTPPPTTTPPTSTTPEPTPPTPPPATTTPEPAPTPPPATTTPEPTPTPPPATTTPEPQPQAWPREGSHVSFRVEVRQSFSGSDQWFATYANATWTYRDGDWTGVCEGNRHSQGPDGPMTITPIRREYTASDPPHWPLFNTRSPPAIGEDVQVWHLRGCEIESEMWGYRGTDSTLVNGAAVTTHRAASDADDIPYDFATDWSVTHGLVLEWYKIRGYGTSAPWSMSGELTSTDAPMG